MKKGDKMALVGKRVSFAEAEESDLFFWADKTWKERLQETERLRKLIWKHILGYYPEEMKKTGGVIKFSTLEK